MEEEGMLNIALKETTAKGIIKLVAPTRRKNLTCVDERVADGMKVNGICIIKIIFLLQAFDDLFSVVADLLKQDFIDKQTADGINKALQRCKSYLRGDFKVIYQLQ